MSRINLAILCFALCFACMLALGCKDPKPTAATGTQDSTAKGHVAPRLAASRLTVLIVDDAPIAAGLKILRGEWSERSGGQLIIKQITGPELQSATELQADLIIYPSRYIGSLVAKNRLRPVRKSVLQSEEVAISDIFPLIRDTVLPYGGEIYALTLGESPLMLAGPTQATADNNVDAETPPSEAISTWRDLDLRLNTENSPLQYPLAVEMLVRGTTFAHRRGQSPGWFDSSTMQAKIASPAFVRALEQMQAEKSADVAEQAPMQESIVWPSAMRTEAAESLVFRPLPVAAEVYNPLLKKWESNESQASLVFLGFAGRSASVTRSTRNSSSAFKLLQWIASDRIVLQLSPRSEATAWFRQSQVAKASKWLPPGGRSGETSYAVTKLLSAPRAELLPRIPGIDDYLKSLAESLRPAFDEELSAEEVLAHAAQQWDALTEKLGRDRQRTAYRKHLGLVDLDE